MGSRLPLHGTPLSLLQKSLPEHEFPEFAIKKDGRQRQTGALYKENLQGESMSIKYGAILEPDFLLSAGAGIHDHLHLIFLTRIHIGENT